MSLLVPMDCDRNDHMRMVEARLGAIVPTATEVRREIRYVFLCFTNRCGSNFLANALSSSGHLNRANEFFNGDTILDNCVEENLTSVSEYFNWLTYRAGKNGFLVGKLSYTHLEILGKAGILDRIIGLSRFVMVERVDKLAQAISYDLALQTGQWAHSMASRKSEAELEFSYGWIAKIIEAILDQNQRFARFFALNGIIPSVVLYERLAEDPDHQVTLLGRYLGVRELRYVPENVDPQRQAGRINCEWRDRFLGEFGELADVSGRIAPSDLDERFSQMTTILPDLSGLHYLDFLRTVHEGFLPRAYLEIGTRSGDLLALANCASVAIDPHFLISSDVVGQKPACLLYQSTSDDYFARQDPRQTLGQPVDFAFLDGLHLFEALLKDVMNTERVSHPGSLIAIHDCIPTDIYIAERKDDPMRRKEMGSKPSWWTGDVWKIVPILRRYRPDIMMTAIDCAPTGLLLLTNLNPESRILAENYKSIVDQFEEIDLASYGLERFNAEVGTQSALTVRMPITPWTTQSTLVAANSLTKDDPEQAAAGVSIPDNAVVQRITSPPFTMTYPNVWHIERIPPDVLRGVEQSWKRTQFPLREVTVSLLEDVIVAEHGLVFTRALHLLQPSIAEHSPSEIKRARHAILAAKESGKMARVDGIAALCKKRGACNYGHWMLEMLPKAFVVREFSPHPTRYIVHATPDPLASVVRESLRRLGIGGDEMIEVGSAPVRVERLLLVDGLTSHGTYMSPLVMECMDRVAADIAPAGMKNLFVLREGVQSRRLVDEGDICALAAQRGFLLLDPGSVPLAHQIACFKAATRIVGVMGAAMTNLAFSQPGTEVFNLAPANMADTFFWFIAGLRDFRYTEVRCEQVPPLHGPMPWDTDLLLSPGDRELIFSRPEPML